VEINVNIKVKLSLCFFLTEHHAVNSYWESGGIAPLRAFLTSASWYSAGLRAG
jgi:hypothetical protein